jgi:hypothetical protein
MLSRNKSGKLHLTAKVNNMARKPSAETLNKSAHVRRYLAQYPDAKPKQILDALTAQGIDISKPLINRILYGPQGTRKKKRRGRRPKIEATANGSAPLSLEHLLAAKKLVTHLGSVESAKQAVDALARLSG